MKEHWNFLKESDHSFGVFYPLHYTMAAFDNLEHAKQARAQCLADGVPEADVAAVSGSFVTEHLESEEGKHWFNRLRAGIAEVIGTETEFLDDDVHMARRGGAFLFLYTPDRDQVEHMHTLIRDMHPVFARRYHRAGIENICYQSPSTL